MYVACINVGVKVFPPSVSSYDILCMLLYYLCPDISAHSEMGYIPGNICLILVTYCLKLHGVRHIQKKLMLYGYDSAALKEENGVGGLKSGTGAGLIFLNSFLSK